jgi:hypothetical protein
MRKPAIVGALLFLGLLAGLAFQPDDGTAVQRDGAEAHSVAAGANHAKPLPRVVTPADLLPTLAFAVGVLALAALTRPAHLATRLNRGTWLRRSRLRSLALAQRGPPLFV